MRILGLVVLVVGIALLGWGYQAYESMGSQVAEVVTGSPSDKAIWLLGAGAVCSALGAVLLLGRR